VPQSLYDKDKVTRYREAATELHKLRVETGQQIESAIESGDKVLARSALEELKVRGAEFHKLRETLTARDLFVAKYNIQVHGPHEVSFVLPKGVSRVEMLSEGQELVSERKLVVPTRLNKWQTDNAFTASSHTPERIRINGHVKDGDAQDRATQEKLVKSLGHTLPTLEDLAAAFVANYVATGEPLFGWFNEAKQWSFVVRAAGGALGFDSGGLGAGGIGDDDGDSDVAVAALVPRN
jgi:hypothetical protein